MKNKFILQVNGNKYDLGRQTWIMGVLNVTPDSFSDGGLFLSKDKAVKQGLKLIAEGADILDIGGESTRPGSEAVTAEEELKRVVPVISALRKHTDTLISIDSTKSQVSRAALDAGADIINDISSFRFDPEMIPLAAERQAPVIIMHMLGTPKNMQNNPHYENLLYEVKLFLEERIEAAVSGGIKKENIIIDPGIGFGKRQEDNLCLLRNLNFLEELGQPILVGPSRKAFIGGLLTLPPQERIEGSIASALISLLHGANILRIHDVAAVKRAAKVADSIMNKGSYA